MLRIFTPALLAMLLAVHGTALAERWNAQQDWCDDGQQPQHGWQFLQYDPHLKEYTPLTWHAEGQFWQGTPQYLTIKQGSMCPDQLSVVRAWTAPKSGVARITSREPVRMAGDQSTNQGDGVVLQFYRNRFKFFEHQLAAKDDVGFSIDTEIRVNQGDILYLHVNPGLHSGWDSVIFHPVIELTEGVGYDTVPQQQALLPGLSGEYTVPEDGALCIDSRGKVTASEQGTLIAKLNGDAVWTGLFGGDRPLELVMAVRTNARQGDVLTFESDPAQHFEADATVRLLPNGLPEPKVVELEGDQHITDDTLWLDGHYKVHGNIYLEEGGQLTVAHSIVEVLCSYSREFNVWWKGGTLITDHAIVGGTNETGRTYHANFEIKDGAWFSTDTQVRFTYGHVFSSHSHSMLRGLRHNAGPHSDAIIMNGLADVELTDSTYPIALNFSVKEEEAKADLTMPLHTPITVTYDKNNLPGCDYRLKLINHKVPFWFTFVKDVRPDGPPAEVILRDCQYLISGINGHNLQDDLCFPCWQPVPNSLPPHSTLNVGNVTFRTLDKEATFSGWSPYLSGSETDFTMRGPTRNGEFMLWGGRAALIGDENTYNAYATCTTWEVGGTYGAPPRVRMEARNCSLGHFNNDLRGQITVRGFSRLLIDHARFGDLLLITHDNAKVYLRDIKYEGEFKVNSDADGEVIYIKDDEPIPDDWDVIAPVYLGTETCEFAPLPERPTIDGRGDDACWRDVPWLNLSDIATAKDGMPPADKNDCAARFKAGWRDDRLYLFVEVWDDLDNHHKTDETWMQDSLEVYLNLSNAYESDFQRNPEKASTWWDWRGGPSHLRFGADGRLAEHTAGNASPMRIPAQAEFAVNNDTPGKKYYEIELKPGTPKDDAGGFSNKGVDKSFGFALQLNDADENERECAIAWLGGPQQPLGTYNAPNTKPIVPTHLPEASRR